MIYLAWIFLGSLVLRFIVVLVNLISRLYPPHILVLDSQPLLSLLIPARNEEKNIRRLLRELQNQPYQNIEVIVYDDESTDNTYNLAREIEEEDQRFRVLKGTPLPKNWLGKNYACFQLANFSKGDYLLFLDADVSVSGKILQNILALSISKNLDLISIFPKQHIHTVGEKLTVPLMNWILLSLLPLFLVRKCSWSSFSAANGQFMLFRAESYKAHQWHSIVRNNRTEDITILRWMKKLNYRVLTLLGDERISCRMYDNYKQGIAGFSKNVASFFGESILAMLLFTISTIGGFFIVLIYLSVIYWITYLVLSVLIHILIAVKSKQPVPDNLVFLIPRQLSFLLIVLTSLYNKITRKGTWKGRSYQQ